MSLPAPAAAQQQQAIPTEETALLGNVAPSSDASNASRRRALIFRAATFGVLGTALILAGSHLYRSYSSRQPSRDQLVNALETSSIFGHLSELQQIATRNRGSRAVVYGHAESGDYVLSQIKQTAGEFCEPRIQHFRSPVWEELSPPKLQLTAPHAINFQAGVDVGSLRFGGSNSSITDAAIAIVPNNGCPAGKKHSVDVKDKIALIEYGASCDLWTAAYNAEKNGAIGVIFYNGPNRKALLGGRTRLVEWKEGDPLLKIPAVAATHSTGALLVKLGDEARITLSTRADMRVAKTFNVICEGKAGDVDKTVVVGAHLDGVAAGPGLNDNGSGSMSTLEILLTLARNKFVPKNRLVFAFWGAEEDGLLGSRHFVRDLVTKYMYEQQKLKFKPIKRPRQFDDDDEDDHEDEEGNVKYEHLVAALNFDMLGSPNYIPGIHNGTDAAEPIRPASIAIQNIFEDFFKAKDIPYDIIDMVGGSDFLPFIQNGVPAGGLATGASDIKTEAQRAKFGGLANAALDPCYHKKCDSFLNVDKTALDVMSHAAMYTVVTLGAEESLNKLFKKD